MNKEDLVSLFEDKTLGKYGVYVGLHDDKALVATTAAVIQIDPADIPGVVHQGDRVYFDAEGKIVNKEVEKKPSRQTASRGTGCDKEVFGQKHLQA